MVTVKDPCTLEITKFTYDGKAPAFYFWASPSAVYANILKTGKRVSAMRVAQPYTGQKVSWLRWLRRPAGVVQWRGGRGVCAPQRGVRRRTHPRSPMLLLLPCARRSPSSCCPAPR